MKQTLDVVYLARTGHVLTLAARAGEEQGPPAAVLVGDQVVYPLRIDAANILGVGIASSDLALDRISVPLDATSAKALFARELYEVRDGTLGSGLGTAVASGASGKVFVTITDVATPTPVVVVAVPNDQDEPVVVFADDEIPPHRSTPFELKHTYTDMARVLVFAKGFQPAGT